MAEVLSPIDEIFDSPEFRQSLSEWQRTCDLTQQLQGQLFDHLAEGYKDETSMSRDEVEYQVSMRLESSPEEFEDLHDYDPEAVRMRKSVSIMEGEQDVTKARVLEISNSLGISQFAAYGLRLHMGKSQVVGTNDLKSNVIRAQQDFDRIDELIRNNSGEILTYIDLGVYAVRLGEGGINLVDKNSVAVPLAEGAKTYMMSFSSDMPKIYDDDKFLIRTSNIHSIFENSKPRILDGWSEFLRIPEGLGYGVGSFAVGDVCEGPPYISRIKDREFYLDTFDKIRRVGVAAATSADSL